MPGRGGVINQGAIHTAVQMALASYGKVANLRFAGAFRVPQRAKFPDWRLSTATTNGNCPQTKLTTMNLPVLWLV